MYKIEKEWYYKDFKCCVIMTEMGHRCGYVGVNKAHCLYDVDYNELWDTIIDVHGGITYSSGNINYPVYSHQRYWFGYDCAHLGDGKDLNSIPVHLRPIYGDSIFNSGTIRSLEYCQQECLNLADQLELIEIEYRTKRRILFHSFSIFKQSLI